MFDLNRALGFEKEYGVSLALQAWLQAHGFPDFSLDEIRTGHYGLVMIFNAERGVSSSPRRVAVKTFRTDETVFERVKADQLLHNFNIEIRQWMRVPSHHNVLPALDLKFIPGFDKNCNETESIPAVVMPYCNASLSDWLLQPAKYTSLDRCVAIGHLCNGLEWLRKFGIEGHGDLKPDNVLVSDLSERFEGIPSAGWPSELGPWVIRVSDLGWANAWRTFGFYDKGWEPYLAPERYRSEFNPEKSDVFSIGAILAELLTGIHPSGIPSSELTAESKKFDWRKWAQEGPREIHHTLPQSAIWDLVKSCLESLPENRPTTSEIIDLISAFTSDEYDYDLSSNCRALNSAAEVGSALIDADMPLRIASLGFDYCNEEILRLEQLLRQTPENKLEVASWFVRSKTLFDLYDMRNGDGDNDRKSEIAKRLVFLLERCWELDLRSEFYPLGHFSDLDPREIPYDYATKACRVLANSDQYDLSSLLVLMRPIDEMYKRRNARKSEIYEELLRQIKKSR